MPSGTSACARRAASYFAMGILQRCSPSATYGVKGTMVGNAVVTTRLPSTGTPLKRWVACRRHGVAVSLHEAEIAIFIVQYDLLLSCLATIGPSTAIGNTRAQCMCAACDSSRKSSRMNASGLPCGCFPLSCTHTVDCLSPPPHFLPSTFSALNLISSESRLGEWLLGITRTPSTWYFFCCFPWSSDLMFVRSPRVLCYLFVVDFTMSA